MLVDVKKAAEPKLPATCESPIYCTGSILHVIQFSRIYDDCKTFVDLKLTNGVRATLLNFEDFMRENDNNPSVTAIKQFVEQNFEQDNELEEWVLPDFNSSPAFLEEITDPDVKDYAQSLINIWPSLAKKVKYEVQLSPEQYSIIHVPNGFIIPGGRFKELYYWDSYWIIDGLLVCDMFETARGMLDNFISIVKRHGFIPNGTRVYYLQRSQPPLLVPMAYKYYELTKDKEWIYENIQFLEEELTYFLEKKSIKVVVGGEEHILAHYNCDSEGPRPESYREDIHTASYFDDPKKRQEVYNDIKAGAESGWDFTSRWIFDHHGGSDANLTFIETRRVVPVDLNAILYMSFSALGQLYFIAENPKRCIYWHARAREWKTSIEKVLWNEEDGIWYDYDIVLGKHRKNFYPSNLTPLWTNAFDPLDGMKLGKRAVQYLVENQVLDIIGGTPSSLTQSGEQWDYPNAWPPCQSMIVEGLENTGSWYASKEARKLAERWVSLNMKSYKKHEAMFEKYDSQRPGQYGSGGEYEVQSGFGWTNGVVLRFIKTYYTNSTLKV